MNIWIKGNLLLLGKNIDTDQIYPGRYLELVNAKDIAQHCLEGVDPAIASTFCEGDVIVASTNFGCGSSREHAPIALQAMGVSAIVAESFSRIFYRNAINLGLPLLTCPGISSAVQNGERIEINIESGQIILPESRRTMQAEQIGDFAMKILSAGGIKPLFRSGIVHSHKN